MTDAKTALAVRRENGGAAQTSLTTQIRAMEKEYQAAMPKGVEAAQLIRDALTAVRTTRHLDKCDSASVLGGLMTCAQLGLRPGVLGHAWLLPFYNTKKRRYAAQLVIGYQGFIELAHRSTAVASIVARPVHENDEFDVDYGIADTLVHKPFRGGDRGKITDYYAIVKFHGGGYAFWTMSRAEAEKHRDKYATARNKEGQIVGPWVSDFDGMALKTTVRMLAKFMPKSPELAQAIEADNSVRVDLSPDVEPAEAAEFVDGEIVDEAAEETAEADGWPEVKQPGGGS